MKLNKLKIDMELHGDRNNGDSKTIICGFSYIKDIKCMLITCTGCPSVKAYKKAYRCMELANKFGLPIITLINTPGAWPLETGISYTIAQNLKLISKLQVPLISIIIGKAYSGGALALMSRNHVAMLSSATYSVISPKGACAILKTPNAKQEVAKALKITAQDNLKLRVIEQILDDEDEIINYIVDCLKDVA